MAIKHHKKRADRNSKGQFTPGHPGKQKGTVSKSVMASRKLVAGCSDELTDKAIQMALDGDVVLLKFFLSKFLPRFGLNAGIQIPVSKNPEKMTAELLKALQHDGVTADDTQGMTQAVSAHLQAVELQSVLLRLDKLENENNNT